MHLLRKQDLSVLYWLKNLFADSPMINVVDGFPETGLVLPTVALEEDITNTEPIQLGDRTTAKIRNYFIDIFAETKTQRNEIGYRLLEALDDKISIYNYDEGFPPGTSPSKLGVLDPTQQTLEPIKVLPELTEKLYYRATVSFLAEYSQLGG